MSGKFTRAISLPPAGAESFFLWGPRQTGKTTLLRARYPDAPCYDLLHNDVYRRILERPELVRHELEQTVRPGQQVVIDEIQKVPQLLDEVHAMIESLGLRFALAGSSARKLRRGAANLLGGRALRYELHGLTAAELGSRFDLTRLLNHGTLPRIYLADDPEPLLRAYATDYLKEEVAAEGLTRNLPSFSTFLNIAALSDGEQVNFENIARSCGVAAATVKNYFQILEDTLLGRFLDPWQPRPKQRTKTRRKFYFQDVGLVNQLAQRGVLRPGGELYGKAFENWVFHELCAFRSYRAPALELSYWRTPSGAEVDFILGDMALAIEAKSSERVDRPHTRGLRLLQKHHPQCERRIVVSRVPRALRTDDGIEVLPYAEFVRRLWGGEFLSADQMARFR